MDKFDRKAADRRAAQDMAKRIVEHRLAKRLGWSSGSLRMTIPSDGKHSLIFIVQSGENPPIILRLFEDAESFIRHRRSFEILNRHESPTPRGLYHSSGWMDRWRFGFRFAAESLVAGIRLDRCEANDDLIVATARALAQLHSVESDYWGYVASPEKANFATSYRRRVERRINDLDVEGLEFDADVVARIRQWFLDRVEALNKVTKFQLCHFHLGKDDILYDAEANRTWLIDCGALQFNRASRDLAHFQPFMKSWIADEDAHRRFIEAYLSNSPVERRSEYEREGSFFAAFLILSRLRKKARRIDGNGSGSPLAGRTRVLCDRLLELTEGS